MNRSILGQVFAWLVTAYQRQQAIHRLSTLEDHLLRDIGLDRSEIRDVVHRGLPPMETPIEGPRLGHRGFRLRPGASRSGLG